MPSNLLWFVSVALVFAGCAAQQSRNEVRPAQAVADAEFVACECEILADHDAEDLEEAALPRLVDRSLGTARRVGPTDADSDLRVFFGNLHSHTSYSDGSGFPEEAFEHARDEGGLDFLALTEHNHKRAGSSNGRRIAHHHDRYEVGTRDDALIAVAERLTTGSFVALYGQEFSSISSGNHLNVFDVPKVINEDDVPNGRFDLLLNSWLPDSSETDSGESALVQMNHPWNSTSPSSKEYGRDDFGDFDTWVSKLDARAQLIEVINGPSHSDAMNVDPATVSASEFRRYLGMGFHLAPTANQDNHERTWGTITKARTAVIATSLSKDSVLDALRNRNVYASLDHNLELIATVEGELMGSILEEDVQSGLELDLEISIRDGDEDSRTYWVEVYADTVRGGQANGRASLVATYGPLESEDNIDSENTWELLGLVYEDWDYLYLKVREGFSQSPRDQAYLAPVWF